MLTTISITFNLNKSIQRDQKTPLTKKKKKHKPPFKPINFLLLLLNQNTKKTYYIKLNYGLIPITKDNLC